MFIAERERKTGQGHYNMLQGLILFLLFCFSNSQFVLYSSMNILIVAGKETALYYCF